jgi:hypothetical protein
MSIFHRECGEAASGVVCQHIAHYYQNVGGDPAVFYYLDPAQLPANYTIIETLSDTGDECHREVVDVSNSALKKRFKGIPIDQFFICDGSGARPLTPVDIAVFREAYG